MTSRESRAAQRRTWPVVKGTLAEADSLSAMPEGGQAAWDAVIELSLAAWSQHGLPQLPADRRAWPSRKFSVGEHAPDSHGL